MDLNPNINHLAEPLPNHLIHCKPPPLDLAFPKKPQKKILPSLSFLQREQVIAHFKEKAAKSAPLPQTRLSSPPFLSSNLTALFQRKLHLDTDQVPLNEAELKWLFKAIEDGDSDELDSFLGPSIAIDSKNWEGSTLLMHAAAKGELNCVQLLIKKGAFLNAQDLKGRTALMHAALNDQLESVTCLIEEDSDQEIKDDEGSSALALAAEKGHLSIVRYLVDKGAQIAGKDKGGYTPLMSAILAKQEKTACYLAKRQNRLNDSLFCDRSNLLMAAASSNSLELAKLLVGKGLDLNAQNELGITALMIAAQNKNSDLVNYLIDQGAYLHLETDEGYTALMFAVDAGDLRSVRCILRNQASADHDIVNMICNKGKSALSLAVEHNFLEMVQILVQQGADLNLDFEESTPLHKAASKGYLEIVRYLLSENRGKEWIDTQDKNGFTALMKGACNGNLTVVEALVEAGAHLHLLSKDGFDAFSLATFFGHEETALYLKGHNPAAKHYTKELYHRKWLAHLYEIGGSTQLNHSYFDPKQQTMLSEAIWVPLTSFYRNAWWKKVTQGTQGLTEELPQLIPATTLHLIQEMAQAAQKRSPKQLLAAFKMGAPLAIATGFTKHHVTALFLGSHFILCNRGELSKKAFEVYRFDVDCLTEKVIRGLLKRPNKSKESYQRYLAHKLPRQLNVSQTPFEEALEQKLFLPRQEVGNCTWASIEAAIYTLFILPYCREEGEIAVKVQEGKALFYQWLHFQKAFHLEKYLQKHEKKSSSQRIDRHLVKKSLKKLKKYETDDSVKQAAILKRIHRLKEASKP